MTKQAENVSAGGAAAPLSFGLYVRLSVMMFLQYAIWGAWLPVLLPFLQYRQFRTEEIGNIFAVGALGAIFAPLVAGQVVDRYFSTQRFLGLSHLLGAALVWQLASLSSYSAFLWFSIFYSFIYSPTLALTNALAFHHLPDHNRDFGRVRVWGSIGWIVAGVALGQWLLHRHTPIGVTQEAIAEAWNAGRADAFKLSAILGGVLGVYCFFLPHTPPQKGKQAFATWEALGEVQRNTRLLALFLFSIVISCVHQFYFVHTADFLSRYQARAEGLVVLFNNLFGVGGGGLMTIGQISEIVVLAVIPLATKRFSRKTLLAVGMSAYAVRMALLAYVEPISSWLGISPIVVLVVGLAMHGICFGCFVLVAFMIVDEETTPDVRGSAQSLYNVVLIGVGIIIGSKIAMGVLQWAQATAGAGEVAGGAAGNFYPALFSVPLWATLMTLAAFLLLYPGKAPKVRRSAGLNRAELDVAE